MGDAVHEDTRTKEERLAGFRYWRSRTPSERFAEAWRLSVEAYGLPEEDLRNGPFRIIQRTAGGTEEFIREWLGPNPLHNGCPIE